MNKSATTPRAISEAETMERATLASEIGELNAELVRSHCKRHRQTLAFTATFEIKLMDVA